MGKKPLIGVTTALWIGLSLTGCQSTQKTTPTATYQAPSGNIRGLVNGSSQPSQPSWASQPQNSAAMPTGAATSTTTPSSNATNAGMVTPTGGVDNMKGYNYTPPAISPNSVPVSSNAWPMKPATNDTGIQQTSATMAAPAADPARQTSNMIPLGEPEPKGSLMSSPRTTDSLSNSSASSSDRSGMMMLSPPPQIKTSSSLTSASATPPASTPALMTPPPPSSAGSQTNNSLPPLPGIGAQTNSSLPPLPGIGSQTNGSLPPVADPIVVPPPPAPGK